jgi:hypothetical protein
LQTYRRDDKDCRCGGRNFVDYSPEAVRSTGLQAHGYFGLNIGYEHIIRLGRRMLAQYLLGFLNVLNAAFGLFGVEEFLEKLS